MPLIKRSVLPKYICRRPQNWGYPTESGQREVNFFGDYDGVAVSNVALCGAIRQLASLIAIADEIYSDVNENLEDLANRTENIILKIGNIRQTIENSNPKIIPVPESDLRSFSEIKGHFKIDKCDSKHLFTADSRPPEIQRLYDEATETPIHTIREIDKFRNDGKRSSMYFSCKPVFWDSLKKEKMKKLLEIETRRPASFVTLRDWASDDETLRSDVDLFPVSPGTPLKPPPAAPGVTKLPLPEQRELALSSKFPPELVRIDVSGRGFRRMELFRQSLVQFKYVKSRKRRKKVRRRNTIADTREIRSALQPSSRRGLASTSSCRVYPSSTSVSTNGPSVSGDISFDSKDIRAQIQVGQRWRYYSLDRVPRSTYGHNDDNRLITLPRRVILHGKEAYRFEDSMNAHDESCPLNSLPQSSPKDPLRKRILSQPASSPDFNDNQPSELNISDACNNNSGTVDAKCHVSLGERGTREALMPRVPDLFSLEENEVEIVPHFVHSVSQNLTPRSQQNAQNNVVVKLREGDSREEGTRSSSGNWSGSSSVRTSLDSDLQQGSSQPPRLSSIDTSPEVTDADASSSEGIEPRSQQDKPTDRDRVSGQPTSSSTHRKESVSSSEQESLVSESLPVTCYSPSNTGTISAANTDFVSSCSHVSDGTLTPTQDIQDIPFADDDDSSAFSCDTEGYYTSFHIDSGLRSISYEDNNIECESDISDLYCRSNTGTNSSLASLGTVIMRNPENKKVPPKPPLRVSSLERKENRESIITVIHVNGSTSSREDVSGAEAASGSDADCRSSKEGDSGRDTSGSTTDSSSPKIKVAGLSKISEVQEAEDPKKIFLKKTAINASGIPSMCVITPPLSDDENVRSVSSQGAREGPLGSSNSASDVANTNKVQRRLPPPPPPNKTSTFDPSSAHVVRQPGDGAVAPSLPSTSPSFQSTPTGQQPQTGAPVLKLMSQNRSVENSSTKKYSPPKETSATVLRTQNDFHSLGKSVSERRAEIQSKVLADKKVTANDSSTQKNAVSQQVNSGKTNLVSLKELPSTKASSTLPFGAVTSSAKPTSTNDASPSVKLQTDNHVKSTSVSLDSRGNAIYTSDSLPRPKGHTSFEPGPYIKPPPIQANLNTAAKPRPTHANSIQNMPLPPVPAVSQSQNQNSTNRPNKSSDIPDHASLVSSVHSQNSVARPQSQTTNNVSQTLSGLSSVMQPRTAAQINSARSSQVKSPKTVMSTNQTGSSVQEMMQNNEFKNNLSNLNNQHVNDSMAVRSQTSITKDTSNANKSNEISQNSSETDGTSSRKMNLTTSQQMTANKISQNKKLLLQQQHMELQKQLEIQQQELQRHKARQAEQQNRKEMQSLQNDKNREKYHGQIPAQMTNSYPQQNAYSQEEIYNSRLQQHLRLQNEGQSPCLPSEALMSTQGTTFPPGQRMYPYVQNKPGVPDPPFYDTMPFAGRFQSPYVGPTSRAPTPVQGLSTSSPQRLPSNAPMSLQQQNIRNQAGSMYGSYQSLPRNVHGSSEALNYQMSTSLTLPSAGQKQHNITNSDIYGRIGMTRQVQVGGTLPAGFGRNQRNYSSLPPNMRQSYTPSEVLSQHRTDNNARQNSGSKSLTRRASVLGTEGSSQGGKHVSNPNTPEKALDKKEKSSKKDKEKEKKKKEAKTEKSPKKKLFWTLPLRRKKKEKDDGSQDDDDGGFKDATLKPARRLLLAEDTSFIRYPSPDTGSSDLNSSHSSEMSSGEHGYRSSPSSEVYFYSQRAKTMNNSEPNSNLNLSANMGIIPQTSTPCSLVVPNTRSHPSTPVSPSDPQTMLNDSADLTDLTRNRRYMSREDMYAAMRHPQYYNTVRPGMTLMPAEASTGSTPSSSRSNSPAVFGVNPLPTYAIRPQVRENAMVRNITNVPMANSYMNDSQNQMNYPFPKSANNVDMPFKYDNGAPPTGYREILCNSYLTGEDDDNNALAEMANKQTNNNSTKQTTLLDFKKMILDKSMKSAGCREKVSAVEMLKASRPGIYGYSLPPAPTIGAKQDPPPVAITTGSKGEGIIMPPNSRNTARALLFQSRFGSGRRYRAAKTEIISTTIIEDKVEEELREADFESSDETSTASNSPERKPHKRLSEQRPSLTVHGNETLSNSTNFNENRSTSQTKFHTASSPCITTSTPIKPNITPVTVPPDVSIILTYAEEPEVENQSANIRPPQPTETSL